MGMGMGTGTWACLRCQRPQPRQLDTRRWAAWSSRCLGCRGSLCLACAFSIQWLIHHSLVSLGIAGCNARYEILQASAVCHMAVVKSLQSGVVGMTGVAGCTAGYEMLLAA